MTRSPTNCTRVLAAAALLAAMTGAAAAAGAFAVGACGAFGYRYHFHNVNDARAGGREKRTGDPCKVAGVMRRGCAAVAVDAKNPCGAFGWAINSHLGKAENTSMRRCYQFGGRN